MNYKKRTVPLSKSMQPVARVGSNFAAFSTLPSLGVGTLDAYITYVNRLPMLSAAEELHLAQDYRRTENVDAARGLVLSHLRLVVSVARQYLGYGIPHADLIQDILKNWRLVKLATTKAQRKLFFNLRSNKPTLNALSPSEIDALAKSLDVRGADVREMEMRLAGGDVALESDDQDDASAYAPIQWLSDERHEPTTVLAQAETHAMQGPKLKKALQGLDERSRDIVQSRWLAVNAEGDGAKTLHELANEYGISAERVRQIEGAALKKMRTLLQDRL